MGRLLVDLLPITILSALTPWTIVGVIVLLASKGGVKNAIAFSLGWITAILLLGGVIVFGVVEGADEHARSATWLQIGVQLGFAAALLLFAHVKWRQRPAAGAVVAEPSWIGKLDGMSALVAFVFGAIWINGFLVVPAALEISRADVTGGEKAAALVFYALGATAGPDRADRLPRCVAGPSGRPPRPAAHLALAEQHGCDRDRPGGHRRGTAREGARRDRPPVIR